MARDDNPQYTEPDLWLDDDHFIVWMTYPDAPHPHGGVFWHRAPDKPGGWCCGSFHFEQPRHQFTPGPVETWQLISRDPLTLSPSFLCHCGHHGWLRDGKWVPA